jgi:diaminohydroxyphosphoribosylaminopyrimidine deaminase/5-amino-6-(5-phosphoribosylamino)uracil reductase
MTEREAMARALDLAWRGWGRVQPNPLVGAVIHDGAMAIAEGWHAEYGDRHAEVAALESAGNRARGATLVVTLEPCAHMGRQPPCTDAILAAGIRRVVAALPDPNPVARGGADLLRQAGIDVELGLLADEAAAQNAAFLHRFHGAERPFVALKLATSLDGRIADRAGHSRWISGAEARDYVQWLRAGFDAIAVGGRTARLDDPALTVRGHVQPRVPPTRVVFDRRGELPASLTLLRAADQIPTLVLSTELPEALRELHAQGVATLLVEGGGRLAGALLAAGLVDRYYWIQSPLWLGDAGVPAIAGLPGSLLGDAARWSVVERRSLGADTLLVVDRR